jgi:hypothetical protein
MMKKNLKLNPKPRKPSSRQAVLERDINFFKKVPVSDEYLAKLAFDLVHWALNDPRALKLTQFRTSRLICRDMWDKWLERSAELRDARELALEVIGDRRELGGLEKRFDSSIVSFTMPVYDPAWKELVAWRAALKEEKANQQAQNFIIQMPSFGEMNAISNDNRKTEQVQAPTLPDPSTECPGE